MLATLSELSLTIDASIAGTQTAYSYAYSAEASSWSAADRIRQRHDKYADPWPVNSWYLQHIGDDNKGRFAWQLGVLSHNWPEAADNLHSQGSIFDDPTKDLQPDDWIISASGGRLQTPREWVESYIERATVFVTWPTPK